MLAEATAPVSRLATVSTSCARRRPRCWQVEHGRAIVPAPWQSRQSRYAAPAPKVSASISILSPPRVHWQATRAKVRPAQSGQSTTGGC